MYQFNDQFTKATSQFADVAANANRLALDNAQKAFGLQLATFEENTSAAFAFWNELIEVRDVEGFKSVLPKGAQIARAATERSFGAAQEVFANTVKTNEAIGSLAKGHTPGRRRWRAPPGSSTSLSPSARHRARP